MTHLPCFMGIGLLFFSKPAHPEGSPLHPNLRDAPTKHLISEHTTNPHPQSRYAFKSILRHFLTPSLSVFLTVCLCHLPLRTYLFNMTSSGACDSTQMSSITAAHTSLRWIHIVYIIKCILPLMLWTGVPCYISSTSLHPSSCSRMHSVCSQQGLCRAVAVYQLFIGSINLHSVAASLTVRHVYQYIVLCRKEGDRHWQ